MKDWERLKTYLESGRVHTSLILQGNDGEHLSALALKMAQFLLCKEKDRPCLKCNVCLRITKRIHPDICILDLPDEETLKIEPIRQLCEQMQIPPPESKYRISILPDAHRLNSAASNALLKTLEEPGEGRSFWLLTPNPGQLLATIRSRSIQFTLPSPMQLNVSAELEEQYTELLQLTLENRLLSKAIQAIEDKTDFASWLQWQLRQATLKKGLPLLTSWNEYRLLTLYEESLNLMTKLNSNANASLLLEDFLNTAAA